MAGKIDVDAEIAALHAEATRRSGLADFGPEDYLAPLRMLVEAMNNVTTNEAGRAYWREELVGTLIPRAARALGWQQHPEYRERKIAKPLVICGVPRTGTTALHKLMGVDPQFQGVENWLTAAPMPRPPRETWGDDPNFLRAMRWLHTQHAESPGVAIAHNVAADEIDEQLELQRQSYVSNRWACTWYSPAYDAWWQSQDERPSFLRELDLLRLIGCHDQRRWLLKNPGSIGMLGWWLEAVPDVCVIQTHRDPVKATASISSTLQHIHASFEGEAAERSRRLLGPRELEKWAGMLDKGEPHRAKHEDRFFDVHHADFHADPMGTIGRIYDRFGLHLSAEAEARMAARIAENPEGHGLHTYDLDSFGLERGMILERYAPYIERYGIAVGD